MLKVIGGEQEGEFKAVASGTLPNGKPVVVNADGTVSVVDGSDSSAGSPVVFNSATTTMLHRSSVYDSANNKIVIAYKDFGNSQYGTAIVGTISGSTITFGSSTVFQSASIEHQVITFDSSNNKVVIAYRDGGAGKAIVGTVSGTSISFGSPTTFESASIEGVGITFDTANNKVVISYADKGGSPDNGTAVVGTVSGTSISFGTPVVFESANTDYTSAAFDSNNGKVVIAYSDKGNSNYGTAVVGTVSGTSISFGSAVIYTSEYTIYNAIVFDSNVNKVVISYRAGTDGDKGKSVVGTVSGTSISFGSAATFASSGVGIVSTTYDTSLNKVLVAYDDDGNSGYGTIAIGTVSGTSISFASGGVFESASVDDINITYDTNANKSAVFYYDGGNSLYGTASVFTAGSTNLTAENYIGMSRGVVDSETVTQQLGSVVDITNEQPEYFALAFDENEGKVVVAYKEGGGTEYGLCAVGTVSGTSITFGTPVAYTNFALSSRSQGIAFDSSTNKVVISYCRNSDNHGQAIVGTVSGNSISFGSATTFNAGSTSWVSSVFDNSNSKVVVIYSDQGNSEYGTAIVGTVSGTSISFGTEVVFESAQSEYIGSTFDSTNNKVVAVYRDAGNSGKGTAIVGTVSGTSISFGTAAIFNDASTYWAKAAFDSTNGKAVVIYMDDGNSQYGTAIVGTVSGTDISFGSEVVFNTAATTSPVAAFDSGVGKVTVAYRDAGNSNNTTIVPATVSGTSISFDTAVDIGVVNGGGQSIGIVFDSINNKIVTTFKDDSANDNSAVVFQNAGTILTRGSVTDGNPASLDIIGSVSDNQLSLTAGEKYYVQTDGTLSTTAGSPSVLAGTAISATKLVVKT